MISGRLSEVAHQLRGDLSGGDDSFHGLSTDTRTLESGQLFVALKGPHYNGNRFVEEAEKRGAAGALVSETYRGGFPQIRVPDTLHSLGMIAALWRNRFDPIVVAVTGSVGKTTVKEMLNAILSRHAPTLSTQRNLNNEIGVPLTLCCLAEQHRLAVIEMGANHAREIATLCEIAKPAIGVVTMAAASHLEGFGSVEGVARAKGELFEALGPDGTAIINADDSYAGLWREISTAGRTVFFGLGSTAEVTAKEIAACERNGDNLRFKLVTPEGTVPVTLPLPGKHNISNALAAAAAALSAGVSLEDIAGGLASMKSVSGRLEVIAGPDGSRLVNDTYNANPRSVRAALDYLTDLDGTAWAVLGDMGELGADTIELHGEVGDYARSLGIERLFGIGELSRETVRRFGSGGEHFADQDSLLDAIRSDLTGDVNLLVKGSRMMRLERVIAGLMVTDEVATVGGGS
jgi:UDP-N-acetylmuramoyl-tripeptide--D-alanyl-D-alanine ligase